MHNLFMFVVFLHLNLQFSREWMKVICVLILLRGIFDFSVFLDFGWMGGHTIVFMLAIVIRFLA